VSRGGDVETGKGLGNTSSGGLRALGRCRIGPGWNRPGTGRDADVDAARPRLLTPSQVARHTKTLLSPGLRTNWPADEIPHPADRDPQAERSPGKVKLLVRDMTRAPPGTRTPNPRIKRGMPGLSQAVSR